MVREAELADGTILEFPDETSDDVIRATVKRMTKPSDSAASRYFAGAGRELKGQALGILNLAKNLAITAAPFVPPAYKQKPSKELYEGLVVPQVEQFKKAYQDVAKEGDYLGAVGHTLAGAVPMIGPAVSQKIEQFKTSEDTAGTLGELSAFILTLLAPSAVKGVRGRMAAKPKPSPTIAPTRAEASSGVPAQAARILGTTPIGARYLREAVERRQPAVQAATNIATRNISGTMPRPPEMIGREITNVAQQRMIEPPTPGTVVTGPLVGPETYTRAGQIVQTESAARRLATTTEKRSAAEQFVGPTERVAVGKELKGSLEVTTSARKKATSAGYGKLHSDAKKLDVKPELTNSMEVAAPIAVPAGEAATVLADVLTDPTFKWIQKIAERKEGVTIPKEYAGVSAEIMDMIKSELAKDAPPPSLEAITRIRSRIGSALASAQARATLGNETTGALQQLYGGLTRDIESALEPHPQLLEQWKALNKLTAETHEVFGKGLAEQMLKRDNPLRPSEAVKAAMTAAPEDISLLRRGISVDSPTLVSFERAARDYLFNEVAGVKSPAGTLMDVNYQKAFVELTAKGRKERWQAALPDTYEELLDFTRRRAQQQMAPDVIRDVAWFNKQIKTDAQTILPNLIVKGTLRDMDNLASIMRGSPTLRADMQVMVPKVLFDVAKGSPDAWIKTLMAREPVLQRLVDNGVLDPQVFAIIKDTARGMKLGTVKEAPQKAFVSALAKTDAFETIIPSIMEKTAAGVEDASGARALYELVRNTPDLLQQAQASGFQDLVRKSTDVETGLTKGADLALRITEKEGKLRAMHVPEANLAQLHRLSEILKKHTLTESAIMEKMQRMHTYFQIQKLGQLAISTTKMLLAPLMSAGVGMTAGPEWAVGSATAMLLGERMLVKVMMKPSGKGIALLNEFMEAPTPVTPAQFTHLSRIMQSLAAIAASEGELGQQVPPKPPNMP